MCVKCCSRDAAPRCHSCYKPIPAGMTNHNSKHYSVKWKSFGKSGPIAWLHRSNYCVCNFCCCSVIPTWTFKKKKELLSKCFSSFLISSFPIFFCHITSLSLFFFVLFNLVKRKKKLITFLFLPCVILYFICFFLLSASSLYLSLISSFYYSFCPFFFNYFYCSFFPPSVRTFCHSIPLSLLPFCHVSFLSHYLSVSVLPSLLVVFLLFFYGRLYFFLFSCMKL